MKNARTDLYPAFDQIKEYFLKTGLGFTIVLTAHAGSDQEEVYHVSQGPDGRRLIAASSLDMMNDGRFTGHPMDHDERW